ncbi:MAG TPA: hypothetical protein VF121_05050 [Thermoanaerobaculia bacterium]|nr:hypothetical protein [Thermoanaerobaculia bacterium]
MDLRTRSLVTCILLCACSQAPQPAQPEAATPVEGADRPADPAPQPSSPAEQPPATEPRRDPTVVVIDPGGPSGEVDLVTAAKAERERRAGVPAAKRVITNDTLVKTRPGEEPRVIQPAAPAASAPALPSGSVPGLRDEAYWRGRSRDLRQSWKDAVDQVAQLESDADLLRRRFYAEADPYVRDGQIKPDWDRVLDRIREMRDQADRRHEELVAHLEEGRLAGALPGWLREGTELEPAPPGVRPGERPHEAVEPPIYPEPRETEADEDGDG